MLINSNFIIAKRLSERTNVKSSQIILLFFSPWNVYLYVVWLHLWWKSVKLVSYNESWCSTSSLYNVCSDEIISNHQEEGDGHRKYDPSFHYFNGRKKGSNLLFGVAGGASIWELLTCCYVFPFMYSFLIQLWSWIRIQMQGRGRRSRSERVPGCFWLEQRHWSAFFWEGGSARADVYLLKAKYWGEWGFQFWRMHWVWGVSAAVRSSVEIFSVDMCGTEGTGLNWTYRVGGDSK